MFLIQQLFDQQWHKIMLGVTDKRAKLWVDCQPVKSIQGYIETPLKERGQYDTQDGYLSIAQIANSRSYQVRIAPQFMVTVFEQMINSSLFFFLVSTSCEYTMRTKAAKEFFSVSIGVENSLNIFIDTYRFEEIFYCSV